MCTLPLIEIPREKTQKLFYNIAISEKIVLPAKNLLFKDVCWNVWSFTENSNLLPHYTLYMYRNVYDVSIVCIWFSLLNIYGRKICILNFI